MKWRLILSSGSSFVFVEVDADRSDYGKEPCHMCNSLVSVTRDWISDDSKFFAPAALSLE